MTILRLGSQDLFVHSPTHPTPELLVQLESIGTPKWLVGPNRIHYWWLADWERAFPDAAVYLAPGIEMQAGARLPSSHCVLNRRDGYPWDNRLETLPVVGDFMTEVVFFDRESRTLVLTDLIENFESPKLGSFLMRWLTRLGGVQDPHGSMPRDLRLTFRRHRAQLKAAIETLIAWAPERVILAHGRWYDRDAVAELRRAFAWLLD